MACTISLYTQMDNSTKNIGKYTQYQGCLSLRSMVKVNVIKVNVQGQNCRLSKVKNLKMFSAFFAGGNFCCLLVTFANSLDPDQDQWNVVPDLDPNHLTL